MAAVVCLFGDAKQATELSLDTFLLQFIRTIINRSGIKVLKSFASVIMVENAMHEWIFQPRFIGANETNPIDTLTLTVPVSIALQ